MSAVRWSVLASMADKYASQGIAVITLAVMSRILTPAETGLYLLANSVILISENLRVFGVGIFVVQEKTLNREILRSVFTVTCALSFIIALMILASADVIAAFFAEPDLAHLLRVATLALLIAPFSNPNIAVLQRELAFTSLALLNVTAAAINAVVTISLGLIGFGAMSFVWGIVASSVVLATGAISLKPDFSIFQPTVRGTRRIFVFGSVSSLVTVLNMAYEMLPRFALAQFSGVGAVGIFGRAVTVCQLPDRVLVSALQPVVLPAMAANSRAGGDLKRIYLRGHTLMSAVQWPSLIMLVLLADPVVRILLGSQWAEAAPLVRIIAAANMSLAPAFMTFPLLVSLGRIRDTLYWTLIMLPPSAAIVIVAATVSAEAVAASLLVIAPLQMLVALHFIGKVTGLRWNELWLASQRSLVLVVGTAAVPTLVCFLSPRGFDLDLGQTVFAVAGGAVGWLAAVLITDHPIRWEVAAMWEMLSVRFRRFRAPARPPAE